MKCQDLHKRKSYLQLHPIGYEWGMGSSTQRFFARNYMKYPDLHQKSCLELPSLGIGCRVWSQFESLLIGIKWNIQVCTKKSCLQCPSLWGQGRGVEGQGPTYFLARDCMKSVDLDEKIMVSNPSPLLGESGGGSWSQFTKNVLLESEWNILIWMEKNSCLQTPTMHGIGVRWKGSMS